MFTVYRIFLNRKEFGLDKFVPVSLMESMKRKELRKLLTQLLKFNQEITGTPHKTLTSLQAKLYYLTIMSELPSYGAKCFSTGIRVGCKFSLLFAIASLPTCLDDDGRREGDERREGGGGGGDVSRARSRAAALKTALLGQLHIIRVGLRVGYMLAHLIGFTTE